LDKFSLGIAMAWQGLEKILVTALGMGVFAEFERA
jgi:hypothetical protein